MVEYNSNNDQTSTQSVSSNFGYVDANALQLRLDSLPLIKQFEYNLIGVQPYISVNQQTGESDVMEAQISDPICNRQGAKMICNYILAHCNAQVFQGNIKEDIFFDVIVQVHIGVACYLMNVRNKIGLDIDKYSILTDMIVNFIMLELSGVQGGFRNNSLTPTLKTLESNTIDKSGPKIGLFKRGV